MLLPASSFHGLPGLVRCADRHCPTRFVLVCRFGLPALRGVERSIAVPGCCRRVVKIDPDRRGFPIVDFDPCCVDRSVDCGLLPACLYLT